MAYKPINIRDILNSKINGPQEPCEPIDILQKHNTTKEIPDIQAVPVSPTLKVHLDITSMDRQGNRVDIRADITTQDDLQKFNALYEKHLPKKGWLGLW